MSTISIKGLTVFYKEEIQPNQDDAQPILFIHGAGCTSHRWFNQLPALSGPWRPVALDLPGHGQTEGTGAISIEEYSSFIRDFTEGLGFDRFVLAGHSMGGAITLDFARKYPEKLTGIALFSTGARLRADLTFLEILKSGKIPLNFRELAYSEFTPDEIFNYAESDYRQVQPEVRYRDFLACHAFDLRACLREINLPALIVVGNEDVLTPVKYSRYLHENLPQGELVIIPGAGHMAMLEQPDAVNRALNNFLTSLTD